MACDSAEECPGIFVGPLSGSENPRLRGVRPSPLADAGEVGKDKPGGLERVVTGLISDDDRQLRLHQHRQLARELEHAVVGRDEAIEGSRVMMQRQQDLPVIEVGHARIDDIHRQKLSLNHVPTEHVDDRLWKVVVESEKTRRHGSASRRLSGVPAQLLLKVEGLVDGLWLDRGVEARDLVPTHAPVTQGG